LVFSLQEKIIIEIKISSKYYSFTNWIVFGLAIRIKKNLYRSGTTAGLGLN